MKKTLKNISLLLVLGLVLVSCKKESTTGDDLSELLGKPFMLEKFKCDIDGQNYEIAVSTESNDVQPGTWKEASYALPDVAEKYVSFIFNTANADSASVRVGTLKVPFGSSADEESFKGLFSLGSKSYSANAEDGFEVNLWSSDRLWSTSKGSANQDGSTFVITKVTEEDRIFGTYLYVEATFACKIYDDAGSSKMVTNGEFIGSFTKE